MTQMAQICAGRMYFSLTGLIFRNKRLLFLEVCPSKRSLHFLHRLFLEVCPPKVHVPEFTFNNLSARFKNRIIDFEQVGSVCFGIVVLGNSYKIKFFLWSIFLFINGEKCPVYRD